MNRALPFDSKTPASRIASRAGTWDLALALPALVLGIFTLMGAMFPHALAAMQWPILTFSALCLGVPHGACDVLAFKRAGMGGKLTPFCAFYLALASATFSLWVMSPGLGLLAFLALTVWHWGEGDAWVVFGGGRAKTLASIGRGLMILSAPLVLQPHAASAALAGFVALGSPAVSLDALCQVAPAFLMMGVALQTGAVWWQWRRENPSARGHLFWWASGETLLLLAFWAVVPPLVGVAIYLCGVHALRHLIRLEGGSVGSLSRGFSLARLTNWHRGALGATVGGLLLLLPMLWLWPHLFRGGVNVSVGYFVLIAALTTPHAATVGFLTGRRQL